MRVITKPFRGRTTRGIFSIAGGSALGQLLVLCAAPILSRLYSPNSFGDFAVVSAVAVILSSVMSLRLERAIAIPESEDEARGLTLLGIWSIVITTLLLLVALLPLHVSIADSVGSPDLANWLWTAPILAAVSAAFALFIQLAIRAHRYGAIGVRNIVQPAAITVAQITLTLVPAAPGLIIGSVVGRFVGVIGLLRGSGLWSYLRSPRNSRACARQIFRSYWRFPIFGMPAGFLNTASLQLPPILVALVYHREIAGQFGMAFMIVALPVTLVGSAIGQVFLGDFARHVRESSERARNLFIVSSRRLLAVSLTIGIALAVLSPPLFTLVLGNQWRTAGLLAQLLAAMVAGRMLAAPLAMVLSVLQRQGLQLVLDVVRVLMILSVFFVAQVRGLDVFAAVGIYSILSCFIYIVQWVSCLRTVVNLERVNAGEDRLRTDRRSESPRRH